MCFRIAGSILMSVVVFLSINEAVQAQAPAQTQLDRAQLERTVEQYTCKDVVRETGASRDVAIAFLHGFLLGKSGSSNFNIETLQKQTDAFLERCLDNPKDKAEDVMIEIKK